MKKHIVLLAMLALVSASWFSATAENHFGDVPAGHWAYDAINKLATDGVIDLYGQGSLRGERTITRYEMAQIVARAIWNSNKAASAEDKGLIDKLKTEFTDELNNLGISVSKAANTARDVKVPKNESPLKISGNYMFRYEYVKNPRATADKYFTNDDVGTAAGKCTVRNRLWLDVTNQFDGDTYFVGSLVADDMGGTSTGSSTDVWQAFLAKKIGDNAEVAVGRMIPVLGLGTLAGTAYNDGVRVSFGKDYKVNLYVTTVGEYYPPQLGVNPYKLNFRFADVKFNLNKDLATSLAYRADKDKLFYDAAAVGLEYKGVPNWIFSGEYARNKASFAQYDGDDTKAFYLKAKYKGANPMVVGSKGFHMEYKKADPNFDLQPLGGAVEWNAPYNYTYRAHGGCANDLKGMEYGFETTVAKRTIFSIQYDDLERVSNREDQSFLMASVFYLF
ncbi:hypothetical protein SPSIL_024690 [Sporomusa silvacetica DSM 10669]|uniref:SLH domain-containing protein n=1 Tax=Sporomusa silvacetica DSM 10669 TaxID=1123289 RepID=A0ABZ3IKX4_9FIRM|nr:S-layer homology domain-containing protein [Sporomusa silvacetica]OZC22747.1 outer membrane protein alpha precursor [Sporomusa silvacetica DSM 10669]